MLISPNHHDQTQFCVYAPISMAKEILFNSLLQASSTQPTHKLNLVPDKDKMLVFLCYCWHFTTSNVGFLPIHRISSNAASQGEAEHQRVVETHLSSPGAEHDAPNHRAEKKRGKQVIEPATLANGKTTENFPSCGLDHYRRKPSKYERATRKHHDRHQDISGDIMYSCSSLDHCLYWQTRDKLALSGTTSFFYKVFPS